MPETTASHHIENTGSRAKNWDDGCRFDPIRNELVIPKLVELIGKIQPERIIDIGCGTGYISREVAALITHQIEWTWLDKDPYRLKYGKSLLRPEMNVNFIEGDIFAIHTHLQPFDFLILAFTILETGSNSALADRLFQITAEFGHLVVIVPDVWTDVWADNESERNVDSLINGSVSIHKIDEFTGLPYPFIATRTEVVISNLTAAGFCLETLDISDFEEKRIFQMHFRRLP